MVSEGISGVEVAGIEPGWMGLDRLVRGAELQQRE